MAQKRTENLVDDMNGKLDNSRAEFSEINIWVFREGHKPQFLYDSKVFSLLTQSCTNNKLNKINKKSYCAYVIIYKNVKKKTHF